MRIISDHEGIEILHKVFQLEAPVSFEVVKKKYRQLSKETHPDTEHGSEEASKTLNVAFESLKELYARRSHIFDGHDETGSGASNIPVTTTDGTPLSELGKGVGFRENGVRCERCGGKGYNLEPITDFYRTMCPMCSGFGTTPRQFACRDCRGTGKFTQARSGKTVCCRKCGGKGVFNHPRLWDVCPQCYGSGKVHSEQATTMLRAFKCYACNGRGQTVVDNPVIPNGVIL